MARPKTDNRTALVDSALSTFWKTGYHVVSMTDLVQATGVSRGGIYSDFSGKQALFHACLDRYQDDFVTPYLAPVEKQDAGITAIRAYLESIISAVESSDSPSMGCLVVNTLAQLDPDDTETRALLEAHIQRQQNAFYTAISNENKLENNLSETEIEMLAEFVTTSIQGLAARYRMAEDTQPMRLYAESLMQMLKARLHKNKTL